MENNNNIQFTQNGKQYFTDIDQIINFAKHFKKSELIEFFIHSLEETKLEGYKLIKKIGKKTDLPPKGYVRITGADNKSDWNELVKIEDIKKRGTEIFDEYPDEDAYYTDLKFFWLLYEDGNEKQLSDIVWDKNN